MRPEKPGEFLLVYSSQTGQAQAIAEELAEKCLQHGLNPSIHCVSQTEKKFWLEREKCLVLITSTTGDGEPPDTALKFWRRIKKKTLPNTALSHLHFAILGLGDSNYTNFCRCGKTFNGRILELGAKPFHPATWADDAVGLEEAVDPWIDAIIPALRKHLGLEKENTNSDEAGMNGKTTVLCDSSKAGNSDNVVNGQSSVDNCDYQPVSDRLNSTSDSTSINVIEKGSSSNSNGSNSLLNNSSAIENNVGKSGDSVCDNDTECLVRSRPPLSDCNLTVPQKPAPYLNIEFLPDENLDFLPDLPIQNDCSFPSAASPLTMLPITHSQILTAPDAVKTTLLLEFSTQGLDWEWEAGDSISILCPNNADEVDRLIKRLGCSEQADSVCRVTLDTTTSKKRAAVPEHFNQMTTLRHLLTHCSDIRTAPSKGFLRSLVDFTSDEHQRRRLQELCSKQGAPHYSQYIRQSSVNISDILHAFPSCHPPVQTVLEHLPRLLPRPYSICSSRLQTPDSLQVAFNIIEITEGDGRSYTRRGVATGYLASLVGPKYSSDSIQFNSVPRPENQRESDVEKIVVKELLLNKVDKLSLVESQAKIPALLRNQHHFRLPEDHTCPLLLIGPGTGVAPFVGFLKQRDTLKSNGVEIGEAWLFYGCRHRDKDFLFKDELIKFEENHILSKLLVSFSRDSAVDGTIQPLTSSDPSHSDVNSQSCPNYVQDNMRLYGDAVVDLIKNKNALVYVCGDAQGMAKGVNEAFLDILQQSGLSQTEAVQFIMQMRLEKRYLEDVWT